MVPSANLLLVGTYAPAAEPGIHAFVLEPGGRLAPLGSAAGVPRPSYVIAHPERPVLYAAGELGRAENGEGGRVWALEMVRDPWALRPLGDLSSGGDLPCHLQLDPSGEWLIVSNYGSGTVGLLRLGPDGRLVEMTGLVEHAGRGVRPDRQEGPHAHSALCSPDGRLVLVADLGADRVAAYRLDVPAGRLVALEATASRPGAGPRHMVFGPAAERLYVANELDCTVSVYEVAPGSGRLREVQAVETLPAGAEESLAADVAMSASGERLYVSNRGHDSVAVFEVGRDGRLTRLAVRPCGGRWPRSIALDPSGRHLVVANQRGDDVSVLKVQPGSGDLSEAYAHAAVPRPSSVRFA